MRLKNESGVFEAVANVKIDGDVGRRKKEEEEKKARLAKEQKEQEEREKVERAMKEERERVEKEMQELERLNFVNNRKLSMLSKDEDKDSGMKIGEDSVEGSEYEEYTETEEDEDFYEEEEGEIENREKDPKEENPPQDTLENKSSHTLTNGDIEVAVTKLGDELVENGGERRRTSDYNGSCDSHGSSGAEDENTESGSGEDKCAGEMWENAKNVGNQASIPDGADVEENNYSYNEVSVETWGTGMENEAEIVGKVAVDAHEQAKNSTETEDTDIVAKNDSEDWAECSGYGTNEAYDSNGWCPEASEDKSMEVKFTSPACTDDVSSEITKEEKTTEEDTDMGLIVVEEAAEPEGEPEPAFDPVEHMAQLQEQLESNLSRLGYLKSDTVVQPQLVTGGDGCLVSLLDQMNKEGQDFKVWERDDFSFLRWYVTKQMESLMNKVSCTNFVEAIDGDAQEYIDRVSDDGVHLDKTFLLAVATIFNKDIVLVGEEGDSEVIEGGIDGRRGKGVPLYLGHIRGQEGKNKDVFISIVPDEKLVQQRGNSLEDDQVAEASDGVEHLAAEEEVMDAKPSGFEGKWKRMDSYNPRDSKDMEQLIQDIESTEGYAEIEEEVTGSNGWENDTEDYPVYQNPYQISTEGMGWFDSTEDTNCDNQEKTPEDQSAEEADAEDCPVYENPYQVSTAGMGWYDSAEESKCDNCEASIQSDEQAAAVECPVYENPYLVSTEGMGWFDSTEENDCDNSEPDCHQLDTTVDVAEEADDESCEGWVYDSNTGYWIRSEESSAEAGQVETEASQNPENSDELAEEESAQCDKNQQHVEDMASCNPIDDINIDDSDPVLEAESDEPRQESVTLEESDPPQKLEEGETGWTNEWAEYAEVEEGEGYDDAEEMPAAENEADSLDCPNPDKQSAEGNAFASENMMDLSENVNAVEEIQEYIAEENGTTSMDGVESEPALAAMMTNGGRCTQHDAGLDMKEASGAEKTAADTEKQARIVRKIKIKAKVNEDKVREQVDPCADPVVASEPTTLSVYPAHTTADTHTHTDPAITESVSGVSQAALELSVPVEKAENTEEGSGKQRRPQEAKCETVPVVCVELVDKEPLSNEDIVNGDGPCGQVGGTQTVTTPDGKTAEVKMRAPLRKYSSKRTASYRWSGTEMFQLEGERTNMCPSPVPESPVVSRKDLEATRAGIAYKKTSASLNKKLNTFGFSLSSTWDKEHARGGDNCVRALIDQICQPWQDFKVWDREDHGFLRWYLAKQVEIQVAGGRQDHFLRGQAKAEPKAFIEKMGQDEEFMNNDFLFSTARVLNKDIYVVESLDCEENIVVFRGGPGGGPGKGPSLLLAHLSSEEAGKDYYQSIVTSSNSDPTSQLMTLPVLEQR